MIRFYTLVLSGDKPQLGFDYAAAIIEAGFQLSIVPIMPTVIQGAPWDVLSDHFMVDLDEHLINVVCSPPGLVLGQKVKAGQMTAPGKVQLPPGSRPDAAAMAETVYEPHTALAMLRADGITNIAITRCILARIDESEIAALQAYNGVICPFDNDAELFRGIDIDAFTLPPTADAMQRFFGDQAKAQKKKAAREQPLSRKDPT